MLVYHYTVRMNDTDAAGRIYFADQFRIAHETFEEYLASIGHHFGRFLTEYPFMIPIVHAEADFKVPLFVGNELRIELRLGPLGRTSFRLDYRIVREPEETDVGSVSVTHVTIDKATEGTIPVPETMKEILRSLGAEG
jgi:1,4-dihydroxy-2-naphthoyl-CoA hydrolase